MTAPRYTLRLAPVRFHRRSVAWCRPPTAERPGDGKLARLVPDAAAALDGIAHLLVVDSCLRPPEASRREYLADQRKPAAGRKGVARPGDSFHGWAGALDLNVAATLAELFNGHVRGGILHAGSRGPVPDTASGWSAMVMAGETMPVYPTAKRLLDRTLGARGWHCYRSDALAGKEAHHFAFAPDWHPLAGMVGGFDQRETLALIDSIVFEHTCAVAVRADDADPRWDRLTWLVQALLPLAGGYDPGPADGVLGRRTRGAVAAFRREWALPASASLARTLRCLVAVTALVEDVS